MALSKVVLVQYTTLDTPVAPVQTAPYPATTTAYVDVEIVPTDFGNPYWTSNAGAMNFALTASIPGLTLSSEGILTGTPTTVGNWPRRVEATNSEGTTYAAETTTVRVVDAPVVVPGEGTGLDLGLKLLIG